MSKPNYLIQFITTLLLASGISTAFAQEGIAPNGSYSAIGASLVRTNYAADKCILGECRSGIGGMGINLAWQALPNMIIGLRSQSGQDSMTNTTLKESQGGVYIGFVMGVGDVLDIGGIINPVTKRIESCVGTLCATTEEAGNNVEFFGKWWINDDKSLHLGLYLDSYAYANGTTNPNSATRYHATSLEIGYLINGHHEISYKAGRLKDVNGNDVSATGALAYSYLF